FADLLRARGTLLDAGFRIVAPCPHDLDCPWATGSDWCHFPARLPRSARHRQVKGARLGWEDEKFSYVVAIRDGAGDRVQAERRGLQGGPGRGVGRRLAAPPVSPATAAGRAPAPRCSRTRTPA